jgi:hypothetical protein
VSRGCRVVVPGPSPRTWAPCDQPRQHSSSTTCRDHKHMERRALDYELHGAEGRPSSRHDKLPYENPTPAAAAAAGGASPGSTVPPGTPAQHLSRGRRSSECVLSCQHAGAPSCRNSMCVTIRSEGCTHPVVW